MTPLSVLRSMSSGDVSEFDLLEEREKKFQNLSPASRAISDGDLTEEKEEEVLAEEKEEKRKNSLRLSKAEVDELGLELGSNAAVFSVTTRFQGTYTASCNIHLWRQNDRIVISDIDGTITRSDVRGMLLPLIGASSWAQGEVVRLYNLIASNGYRWLNFCISQLTAGQSQNRVNLMKEDRDRLCSQCYSS